MSEPAAAPADPNTPPPPKGPRLRFIDMARSVAILMMLEGHFVDVTLGDAWRHNPFHSFWNHFRGLAAPMFFATTGLIFVYLLTGNSGPSLRSLPRVRKGLLRSGELILYGYILQLNVQRIPEYFRAGPEQWMGAFHVLQCIGIGILMLIGVYALQRRIPRIPLPACYLAGGICLSLLSAWLHNLPVGSHFPAEAPAVFQNPFKGPVSIFPIAPWLLFTLYGGALGALVRKSPEAVRRAWPWLIAGGLALKYSGKYIDAAAARVLGMLSGRTLTPDHWIHDRAGEILTLLGILIFIEARFRPGESWFLKVGRNTLPIYAAHVVILYGGVTGIGISNYLTGALNPWQASLGALLFMAFFVLFALAVERFKTR